MVPCHRNVQTVDKMWPGETWVLTGGEDWPAVRRVDSTLLTVTIRYNLCVYLLPARTRRVQAGTESQNYVYIYMCVYMGVSAVISSSSSSPSSLEEG